ncbi:MAG TPA: DUF4350 domain-containing protein [Pedococcus sp.]
MTLEVWDRTAAGAGTGGPPTPDGPTGPGAGGGLRGLLRRRRRLGLVVGASAVFALVVVLAVAVLARDGSNAPLDPDNARPAGTRALVRVLDDQGVAVDVVRSQDALLDLDIDPATTVVVTDTGALSARTAASALDHARRAGRVVLVEPEGFVLRTLGVPVSPSGAAADTRSVRAGCALPGLSPGDAVSALGTAYRASDPAATACFTFDGASALVAVPARGELPPVVVLGAGAVLTNGEITRHDNAGVALRLLGAGERVVWYVPDPADITVTDTTPASEVPRALGPLVGLALAAVVAAMLWRGRRFGPLVTEPLPAVVRAIETTQSRGRLYRRAKDTGRAGTILRTAATRRLGRYLGLPAGASPRAVAEAAARATGRPPEQVLALLHGAPPPTEDALVALATDLSSLEKEVHRP